MLGRNELPSVAPAGDPGDHKSGSATLGKWEVPPTGSQGRCAD